MIDVKSATHSACEYLQFIKDMIGDQLEDVRLEEVELSEDEHFWLITLGYDIPVKNRSQIEALLGTSNRPLKAFKREYKLFRVNADTGKVEAMKIRQV